MAIFRNWPRRGGLASLFPPSQRPYTPWLKDDLVRDPIPQDDLASLLQGLGGTGTTGPLGGPLGGPSSVEIDLPSTSPPGSILDLLGGGISRRSIRGTPRPFPDPTTPPPAPIAGPPDIGTVPPPPPTAGPGPETAPVDQGYTIGSLLDQSQPQPPSKAQRIGQLKAQVRALEDQIRQIMLQIRELKGGGRSWAPEAPPGIGMNPPITPWMPPGG